MRPLAVAVSVMFFPALLSAQTNSSSAHEPVRRVTPSVLPLQEASRAGIASEIGGAYMSGSRCDADGNLYLRKLATDRPLLGSVVKIDPDGKRVASFDPTAFSQLHVERADV